MGKRLYAITYHPCRDTSVDVPCLDDLPSGALNVQVVWSRSGDNDVFGQPHSCVSLMNLMLSLYYVLIDLLACILWGHAKALKSGLADLSA